jgi:hypothetical protein
MVPRPTSRSRLAKAPWIRVWPQSRFSVAVRTINARISAGIGGRPGPRRALPSYWCAINRRCQASNVSGETIVAMSRKACRPSVLAFAASRRR